MKAFTIGSVVFFLVICNVLATDFKFKVKNVLTDQEEDEEIDIDTDKGTEVIKAGGQASMKDMKTGYTAIKSSESSDSHVCMIIKNGPSETQESAKKLQENLASMKEGEEPEVDAEEAVGVKTSTDISDEKRAEIGQNLIDFCGNFSIVLGEEESEDGKDDEEEVSEEEAKNFIDKENKGLQGEEDASDGNSKSDTQALSRRKRGLAYRCSYRVVRVRYCIRRMRYVRYCRRRWWGRCISYGYRYSYYCSYYYRYSWRRVCTWRYY